MDLPLISRLLSETVFDLSVVEGASHSSEENGSRRVR
jgi:hypothetical protein